MVQRYKEIEKQRDFKAPQALSGDTELTARAANVLNSVAKVQRKSETTKDLAKRAMETASVSHDEEHQHAVISFAQRSR